jgi:hypothetical protein
LFSYVTSNKVLEIRQTREGYTVKHMPTGRSANLGTGSDLFTHPDEAGTEVPMQAGSPQLHEELRRWAERDQRHILRAHFAMTAENAYDDRAARTYVLTFSNEEGLRMTCIAGDGTFTLAVSPNGEAERTFTDGVGVEDVDHFPPDVEAEVQQFLANGMKAFETALVEASRTD